MRVLVDSSVWIDYFKVGKETTELEYIIDNNFVVTNDLILTELVPFLRLQGLAPLIEAFASVAKLPLFIDWAEIQDFQLSCLKAGVNGIGIPDLIIAQNAIHNESFIFSFDKHFKLIQQVLDIKL